MGGDRKLRAGNVADPLSDEGRQPGGGPDARCGRDSHTIGARGVLDVLSPGAVSNAEVVHATPGGKILGDPDAVVDVHASGDLLFAAQPDSESESGRRDMRLRRVRGRTDLATNLIRELNTELSAEN